MTRHAFVTDCEGPISKNDNAFELAEHYIPDGGKFFRILSHYDDVLAYLEQRLNYSAGYTLRLLAPFLRAYGATNQEVENYSGRNVILIEDSEFALHHILNILPTYIVSTSYEQYIEALCRSVDFPASNTFSTHLDLDKFELNQSEVARLKKLKEEILSLSDIEIPDEAKKVEDLPNEMRTTVDRMDEIFFSELPRTVVGRLLEDVRPIGSREKAEALEKIAKRLRVSLAGFMYLGDSITDVDAFRIVRRANGLAVSFNGNQYAVQEADIAIMSRSALMTALIAEVFAENENKGISELTDGWPDSAHDLASKEIVDHLFSLQELPKIEKVTRHNMKQLIEESNAFRKTVRGRLVGSLG